VTVVADMTATTFCDTMGIRALVLAHKHATEQHAELRLLITSPLVLRIMGILRVDTVLRICLNLDDALSNHPAG
jgi:anti-anti-sigma regulatory factor